MSGDWGLTEDRVLNDLELTIVQTVGRWRFERVLRDKLKRDQRSEGVMFERHVMGAAGEFAVAKDLGTFWGGGMDDFKKGDLPGLEVRTTTHHEGSLITFPRDTDYLVLVVLMLPYYRIIGGIHPIDAHVDQYRPDPAKLRAGSPPQYWVPQGDLDPWAEARAVYGMISEARAAAK